MAAARRRTARSPSERAAKKPGAKAGRYEGKEIIFGFRPESIEPGKQGNACIVEAVAEPTEMLGGNTNVYITAGEEKAILKADPHDTPEMDAAIVFSIPHADIYLFDGESENVIN